MPDLILVSHTLGLRPIRWDSAILSRTSVGGLLPRPHCSDDVLNNGPTLPLNYLKRMDVDVLYLDVSLKPNA